MTLRAGHLLMLVALALLMVGVVMVHSAGMVMGRGTGLDAAGGGDALWQSMLGVLLGRDAIFAYLAVGAMMLASRLGLGRARGLFGRRGIGQPLILAVLISFGLMAMTMMPGMGRSVNGATRWLYLGPRSWGLSFQPSELVKWVMVLAVAWWCTQRRGVMHKFGPGLVPPLLLIGIGCGLIVVEDLGTGLLVGAVAVLLLLAGGAKWWHLALVSPLPVIGAAAAIMQSPYRVNRLLAFMDPWADPQGIGYHPIQSLVAITQGGLAGRGLGNGLQKFGYLPEDTTDFVFAIICEETGLIGAGIVLLLFMALLWFGLGVIRQSGDPFARMVGLGILLTIGLQTLINVAVVTVMVPTKGIALPLVSSGGTGRVLTAAMIGLLASIDMAEQRSRVDDADEPELVGIVLE